MKEKELFEGDTFPGHSKKDKFINWTKWIWFYHICIPFKKIFHLNFYEEDRDKMIELARKIGKAKFYPQEDGTWKFNPYGK